MQSSLAAPLASERASELVESQRRQQSCLLLLAGLAKLEAAAAVEAKAKAKAESAAHESGRVRAQLGQPSLAVSCP